MRRVHGNPKIDGGAFIVPASTRSRLLPAVVREGMDLIQVDSLDQVLAAALLPKAPGVPAPAAVQMA